MKVLFRFIVLVFSIFTAITPLFAQWTPINNNLGSLNITGVARVGTTIYAGTSDKGIFSSTNNGDSWSTYSENGTLPSLNIFGLEGDVITGQNMFIYAQNGMALLQPPIALYVPPFVQTLANKDITLYRQYNNPSRRIVGTKNGGIFFTEDNTTFIWTEATGIPAGASKNIRGFMSQDVSVLLIAGTENGAFKSTDRGSTWTEANTGLSGDALKINNIFSIFALTSNGLYLNLSLPTFTSWTPAVATGDFRSCASDMISGQYYFFGNNVGTSINLNTFQIATIPLGGISGGVITSALLYGTNIFVGTETGGVFRVPISALTTGVNERNELPNDFNLSQNYPNPFNPTTTISFSLPSKSYVSLKVFDALGREVSVLVSDEMAAGTYSKQWNANNLPSGVYFYRLQAGTFSETKKLILLR
ncbi:MAG: T9SS type A sorting domain-containing protein [Ignavibacteriales bacterium]|nr:T9SS type A sorting domain-containing protein [Ignavibacteriales bacterium]